MNYKNLKQAKKLYDNTLGDLIKLKALMTTMYERNLDNYPQNFLFQMAKDSLKNCTSKLLECYDILKKA